MKTSNIIWIIVILIIIAGGAWYYVSSNNASGTPTQTQTTISTTLATSASADLGTYLVASNGMTLYMYTPDTTGTSNCTGQCAVNWPPYTVASGATLSASSNLDGALATLTRDDGEAQVTYKGVPLYFYIKDTKAGDTTGQGVGDVWYVVAP